MDDSASESDEDDAVPPDEGAHSIPPSLSTMSGSTILSDKMPSNTVLSETVPDSTVLTETFAACALLLERTVQEALHVTGTSGCWCQGSTHSVQEVQVHPTAEPTGTTLLGILEPPFSPSSPGDSKLRQGTGCDSAPASALELPPPPPAYTLLFAEKAEASVSPSSDNMQSFAMPGTQEEEVASETPLASSASIRAAQEVQHLNTWRSDTEQAAVPKNIVLLMFSRSSQALEDALQNTSLAKAVRNQGVDIRPAWAKGAKVFVAGFGPQHWKPPFIEKPDVECPSRVVLYDDDVEALLEELRQSVHHTVIKVKPSRPTLRVDASFFASRGTEGQDGHGPQVSPSTTESPAAASSEKESSYIYATNNYWHVGHSEQKRDATQLSKPCSAPARMVPDPATKGFDAVS